MILINSFNITTVLFFMICGIVFTWLVCSVLQTYNDIKFRRKMKKLDKILSGNGIKFSARKLFYLTRKQIKENKID